jgi:FKBP-type peptidyl-prolyl cis-trans isomerase
MPYVWTKRTRLAAAALLFISLSACDMPMDKALATQAEANKTAGVTFLNKVAREDGLVKLPSGILYKVLASPNPTAPSPDLSDVVKVHYEGKLIDGQVFDSSYERGVPAVFPLNNLVKAWQIAIPLMHKGDTWLLYVPAELGYGERAAGPIPPNSVLIFKIELIDILK